MAAVNPRLRLALAVATAFLLAAIVALLLTSGGRGRESQSAIAESARSPFKGAERPRIPAQDFTLTDQDGRTVSLSDYRGQVVMLAFMYTHCRDTCPLEAQTIRGALDLLADGGRRVPALAVSVDPRGDTPQSARAFLRKNRANGRIDYLLGSRAQLRPVWRDYAVAPQTKRFEHSAYVLLIDRHGRQRVSFPGAYLTPEDLAHDARILLRERR